MRISPITSIGIFNLRSTNTLSYMSSINCQRKEVLPADTVCFRRTAENAEPLKALMKPGIIDFWTGKLVIDPDYAEELLRRKEFSKSLKSVVKILAPIKDRLQDVPAKIFEMLEDYAKTRPEAKLDEVFSQWAPLANKTLVELQKPVFKNLEEMSNELPEEAKIEFDELLSKTKLQINKKPILTEFNKRDFRYKLERIARKIRQKNDSEEVVAINKIIKMTDGIPNLNNKKMLSAQKARMIKTKSYKQSYAYRQQAFRQVKNFFGRSVLRDDKELQSLFFDVTCQLNGTKTFIPFSRKNFIDNLEEILKPVANKKLAHRMAQESYKLPRAYEEISAFIVKSSRKPSDKIGYDLIWGSIGNIDHIITYSSGGKDAISNYVVSANYSNAERSNRTIAQQFRKYPAAYKTSQLYINQLNDYVNNGMLKKFGLSKHYVKNIANKIMRLSPPEKPLKLDLSKLIL